MTTPTPWKSNVSQITDGESVKASVANRATGGLISRTQHLKDRMDQIAAGRALIAYSAACKSDCLVGMAVYFNSSNNRYEKALAKLEVDEATGAYKLADESFVLGVVYAKTADDAEQADILLVGGADLDMSNAVADVTAAGPYYLSGSVAGQMTTQKPSAGIYVCFLDGNGGVIVSPSPREIPEDHVHLRFTLTRDAAGLPDCGTGADPVTIQCSDSSLAGWLPADNPVFNGMAPDDAYFGYNLSQHPRLQSLWPPLPMDSGFLQLGELGVYTDLYRITQHGLWWLSNRADSVPWAGLEQACTSSSSAVCDTEDESSSSSVPGSSSSSSEGTPDVIILPEEMVLWFTTLKSKTYPGVVTSAYSDDSRLQITKLWDDSPASQNSPGIGHLKLDLNLTWSDVTVQSATSAVVDVGDGTLSKAVIVGGVKGSGLVTVSGSESSVSGYARGLLEIGVSPSDIFKRLDTQLVALNGVIEQEYKEVPYLEFVNGIDTALRGKISVGPLTASNPSLRLWFWVLSRASGTPPSLWLSYRVLSEPDQCGISSSSNDPTPPTPLIALPTTEDSSNIELDVGGCTGSMLANEYARVEGPSIPVTSDAMVLFTLQRKGSTDAYGGNIGILDQYGMIVES